MKPNSFTFKSSKFFRALPVFIVASIATQTAHADGDGPKDPRDPVQTQGLAKILKSFDQNLLTAFKFDPNPVWDDDGPEDEKPGDGERKKNRSPSTLSAFLNEAWSKQSSIKLNDLFSLRDTKANKSVSKPMTNSSGWTIGKTYFQKQKPLAEWLIISAGPARRSGK